MRNSNASFNVQAFELNEGRLSGFVSSGIVSSGGLDRLACNLCVSCMEIIRWWEGITTLSDVHLARLRELACGEVPS
jgi:hypothetical protein